MHLRRQRPIPPVRSSAPDAPPPPGVATRASADDALALTATPGRRAAAEARARAVAALNRDNLWDHARWRQAERLIRAMERAPDAAARH